ncbi:SIMPL domain-containing protein [Sorangium sp. So ce1036]|uniref:SIMPL domain-containing protein n=1 Tax=Sorangium sp. So ce1036 TaxID=3133328 RepID=UPI003F0E25BF
MTIPTSLWRRLTLAGLLLTTAPLLAACAAQATPPQAAAPEARTITVVGQGEVSAKPDIARAQLGIEVLAPTVAEATQTAAARMTDILGALRKAGLADKDIQTSNYSIQLERQPDVPPPMPRAAPAAPAAPPAGRGPKAAPAQKPAAPPPAPPDLAPAQPAPPRYVYRVSNTVTATIRNLAQVGAVLDAAVAAGANNVWGVSFGLDNTDPLEAQAREKAIADARARAEALARLQGVPLGPVVAISEIIDGGGPVFAAKAAMYDRGAGTPLAPGEVSFSTQVKVVYALGSAPAAPGR